MAGSNAAASANGCISGGEIVAQIFAIGAAVFGLIVGLAAQPEDPDTPAAAPQNSTAAYAREGVVIPDILGTEKVSGNIFWLGPERVEQEDVGKKGGGKGGKQMASPDSTGKKYYKSWAQLLCVGPIDNVYTIYNEDEAVWGGNLSREYGDVQTITLSGMGSVRLYFGGHSHGQDPLMSGPDHPYYRGWAFAVFDDVCVGGVDRHPTVRFVIGKYPESDVIMNPRINGLDYNPAAAVYYLLKRQGWQDWFIDMDSFQVAAQTMDDEEIGLSLLMDRNRQMGQLLGDVFKHIFAVIRFDTDMCWSIKLLRYDGDVSDHVIEARDIIDEPVVEPKSWIDCATEIKINHPLRIES